MTIRFLTDADALAYWNLRLEALTLDPAAYGQSLEQHQATTPEDAADYLRTLSGGSFVLGCFTSDSLTGTLRFVREESAKERHKGNLRSFYVKPSHRGLGLGRALIAEALRIAQADPTLEQINLVVTVKQLAAVELYKSFGFQIFGTERRSLKVGDEYLDDYHMVLPSER